MYLIILTIINQFKYVILDELFKWSVELVSILSFIVNKPLKIHI